MTDHFAIALRRAHLSEIFKHAREAQPDECCGLIGGRDGAAQNVYRARNVARNPLSAYEIAPPELFAAQRLMRARGEHLAAIYHSHPRAAEPIPSETDVRLAYYPSAIYLIVGLADEAPTLRAFRIFESERRWESVEYRSVE